MSDIAPCAPCSAPASGSATIRFGDCELDLERVELRRSGSPVPVEPQVFDVLAYLASAGGRVVSKHELLDAVWGTRFVSESALTSRIKSARRAVGDTGREQRIILTVHGRGYRFVAGIDRADAERPAVTASVEEVLTDLLGDVDAVTRQRLRDAVCAIADAAATAAAAAVVRALAGANAA